MKYDKGDKIKVNGSIQEIENITQWDEDTQRYKFVGVSGWHEIKDYDECYLHLMEDEDVRRFVQSEQYKLSRKMMKIRYELCLDPEDMAEAINMDEYQYVELEFGDESIPVSEYKKCLNDMEGALSVLKFGDLSEFSSKDYSMGFNTDSEIKNENVKKTISVKVEGKE